MLTSLIFDLDGTLVDSSAGILASLAASLSASGISRTDLLDTTLIGPPLRETFRALCHNADEETLEQLCSAFKAHYDTIGFQQTHPFPGVTEMLQALVEAKIPLHIATNKRHRPTVQIIESLGWTDLFDQVLSPDSCHPSLTSKATILSRVLDQASLAASDCFYIGDRFDDYKAANEVDIPFVFAEWGFEGEEVVFGSDIFSLKTPDASHIFRFLADRSSKRPRSL
jgi:phosphoglycolate phosphatase